MALPSALHIHGPGRAACSLSVLWRRAGVKAIATSGGREESVGAVREALGAGVPWTPSLPPLRPDTVLVVGVPDDRIEGVAAELAAVGVPADTLVLHLSGLKGRGALSALEGHTPRTAAFHPLRAFPTRDPGRGDLEGALIATESRPEDLESLESLAARIGGEPVEVPVAARALYHAGAMLSGNAMLAVFDWGVRALVAAGLDQRLALTSLARLAGTTLQQAERRGTAHALTGAVARGDTGTIATHEGALGAAFPREMPLYPGLLELLAGLAERGNHETEAARVRAWLSDRRSS